MTENFPTDQAVLPPEQHANSDILSWGDSAAEGISYGDPSQVGEIEHLKSQETVEQSRLQRTKHLLLGKLSFKKTVEVDASTDESSHGYDILPDPPLQSAEDMYEFTPGPPSENASPMYKPAAINSAPDVVHFSQEQTPSAQSATAGESMHSRTEAPKRNGEFVKEAPAFAEQVRDTSRTNLIEYVPGMRRELRTRTGGGRSEALTEHESLVGLSTFLEKVAEVEGGEAQSMLENLTFIGKQEYDEVTEAIADKWVERLRENPKSQICIVTGQLDPTAVKSDAYLLDNVLKNLSDEQLEEFSGRLLLDPEDLTAEPEDASIVLLDDWTISGEQLQSTSVRTIEDYPQYKDRLEIQLIAGTEERIADGFDIEVFGQGKANVPINAYFKAHAAPEEYSRLSGAHITGAHCAVDFGFNDPISMMARRNNVDMPPATNIVRPYRKPGVRLTQANRLRSARTKE